MAELAARRVGGRGREGRRRLRFRRREDVEQRRDAAFRDFAVFDVRVVLDLVLESDPPLAVRLLDLVFNAAVASAPKPPFEGQNVVRKAGFRQEIAAVFRVDHSEKTVFDAPTGARGASRRVRPTVEIFAVEERAFFPDDDFATVDFKGLKFRKRGLGGRFRRGFGGRRRVRRLGSGAAVATAKRRQKRERSERTGTENKRKSANGHRIILKIGATVNVDSASAKNKRT